MTQRSILFACALLVELRSALYIQDFVEIRPYVTADQQKRLDALKPLIWVHVPKTGGSFQNVLYMHRGICPHIPAGTYFDDIGHQDEFIEKYVTEENCPGGFMWEASALDSEVNATMRPVRPDWLGHKGIGALDHAQLQGHLVGHFRLPEQHIISAFKMGSFGSIGMTLEEFARANAGWMVKQLTRTGHAWQPQEAQGAPPTVEEVEYAKLVLSHDFGFVGITEEFDMSVCLFHAMFGGRCHVLEFNNIRPGALYDNSTNHASGSDLYDTSELNGYSDPYDAKIYVHALQIFNSNVRLYGLDSKSCPQSCS